MSLRETFAGSDADRKCAKTLGWAGNPCQLKVTHVDASGRSWCTRHNPDREYRVLVRLDDEESK